MLGQLWRGRLCVPRTPFVSDIVRVVRASAVYVPMRFAAATFGGDSWVGGESHGRMRRNFVSKIAGINAGELLGAVYT